MNVIDTFIFLICHVEGTFDDFPSVLNTMQGAYGVFVNNDGFTVGEDKEVFAGMQIYELAK